MKTFRVILILICSALIVGMLFTIDYSNLWSKPNRGGLLGITAMILTIISLLYSLINDSKAR